MQQPLALVGVERRQRRGGELVGDAVELGHLGAARGRERQALGAPVGTGLPGDEAVTLERSQQPRDVAGVEPEPRADVARRRALCADLEQDARLAERPVAEVAVVERADLAGDEPVEAADCGDL